ncbi:MAG: hypothetical protein JSW53_04625 [Candidatus Bathyarchaeota archaeon]|nr:MAG: hypothetical protein JSW53_04625 [Candidatus Bathyarchaeota archaeon]
MFNRFLKHKRGVSTIIGVVFFVLVFIGGFSLISWEIMRYDEYIGTVNERNRFEWERQNEIIEIVDMSVVDSLNISITNKGAVTAHLVDLWITEFNTTVNWHKLFLIDYHVNSGDTISVIGADIDIPELDPRLTYDVKIVTERGNIAVGTYSYSESVLPPQPGDYPTIIIGALMLDLEHVRYFSFTHTFNRLSNYPEGIRGFNVPATTDLAFGCFLTNVDPANRTIVLDQHSLMWFTIPVSDVPHNKWWYIVNVADDGTISSTYSDIVLEHGETKLIVFASDDAVNVSGFGRQDTPKGGVSVSVFLLFHGTIGGEPYGQNIPFVSLYIQP